MIGVRTYVDTSVVVAAHVREPHTAMAQAWLARQTTGTLLLSSWMVVESASALAIKVRRGEIDEATRAAAEADIDAFVALFAPLITPGEADFARARALCRQPVLALRAGDSLHVAIASRLAATHFATLDVILARNALAQGMSLIFDLP